jgi:hypothetical protein
VGPTVVYKRLSDELETLKDDHTDIKSANKALQDELERKTDFYKELVYGLREKIVDLWHDAKSERDLQDNLIMTTEEYIEFCHGRK